jgi:AhpD family alkylhydroperoxidase
VEVTAAGERIRWGTFRQLAPQVVSSLRAIGEAVAGSTLEKELLEFVKIRASQLNGCAYCLQLHLNDARKLNVAPEKLDLVATWREAGVYSDREMAALDWTEALTRQAQQHIDDERFSHVSLHFSEEEIIFLTAAIGQINFWNRIAASFRFTPPIRSSAA